MNEPHRNLNVIRMVALFIGQRINTRVIEEHQIVANNPLTMKVDDNGYIMVFRYGVVVFANLSTQQQTDWLSDFQKNLLEPHERIEQETLELVITDDEERFKAGQLNINNRSIVRLQLIAYVLAKSVVLAYYEQGTAKLFDQVEPLANDLQLMGHAYRRERELIRHIGAVLSTQSKMVGRAEVGEKPDLLWDHPELERLFQIMESEYEIRERHLALERKFELVSRTVTTLLDLLQYKRSLRVEWYIVILIIVEILITLGKMVFAN